MIYFFLSLIFTNYLIRKNINFFKDFISSIPNKRSMHIDPHPNGGGIVFAIVTSIFGIFSNFYLPLISLPLSCLGLLDDKYKIKAIIRFFSQLFTIFALIIYENNIFDRINYQFIFIEIFIIFLFLIFAVGIVNIFNFMDGIDGLLCGSMIPIILVAVLKYKIFILLPFLGSLIGFIFLNWYPSKIFMGDSGSLFIGAMYIGILILLPDLEAVIKLLIISMPLIGDGVLCLIRRYLNGKNIFEAHKQHLYQRLIQGGMSHSTVSFIYILSITILSISFFIESNLIIGISSISILFGAIYLERYKAIRFE
tara:strand:+ start:115 stop:1041 length:927 start_codon:yes stop_codon:yes gene_type:complete